MAAGREDVTLSVNQGTRPVCLLNVAATTARPEAHPDLSGQS